MFANIPLTDITNYQIDVSSKKQTTNVSYAPKTIRHDPYSWRCIDTPTDYQIHDLYEMSAPQEILAVKEDQAPAAPSGPAVCNALVQFKCHQAEYSSSIMIDKGQYIVVQGDRGIDIGVVIRMNTEHGKTYVERTGPTGSVLRHATQREVDYWATELKEAEAAAVAYCQMLINRNSLDMQVVHAEYQFDKKKLTFYYESRSRIDFVNLLKELYREFGCRIWMEKVRLNE
ncbi:PSP1 C-terminal conserved region containing protein, putative [Angomonas deanei]|uniref:PSP1 C-terminal conserved region containing protein, putative n=1 Tax=Angomonas deanei TaxID=59799 RepID=A0A7G2C0U3_9TRYP|nr:PSP1 C-terminal conserved region containing protein, putative [Angomonas deanei]